MEGIFCYTSFNKPPVPKIYSFFKGPANTISASEQHLPCQGGGYFQSTEFFPPCTWENRNCCSTFRSFDQIERFQSAEKEEIREPFIFLPSCGRKLVDIYLVTKIPRKIIVFTIVPGPPLA